MRARAPKRSPPPTTGSHGCFWPVSARRAGRTAAALTLGPFTKAVPFTAAPTTLAVPLMVAVPTMLWPAAPPLQLPSVAVTFTVFWITPAPDVAGVAPLIVTTLGGSPG